MMKKIKKIVLSLSLFFGYIFLNIQNTYAAGVSISPSSPSVTIGSSFTVTLTVSDSYALITSATTNNGSVSGGAKDVDAQGESKSIKYTIKPSRVDQNCVFTVKGVYSAYTGSSNDKSFSETVTFNVKEKVSSNSSSNSNSSASNSSSSSSNNSSTTTQTTEEPKEDTRSKENSLASLSVSEGTLSPSFKSSTTKYTVNLSGDKTKISISAKAKDSKAKVSGTGEKTLEVGENTFTVKCTAENGSVKSYTIIVNVDEKPVVYTELNGQKLGVVRNLKGVSGPNKSFEETKVTLDGNEIPAWKSNQMDKTVIYLINENDEKDFYLFENGKVTSKFDAVSFAGINMFAVDIHENMQKIEGMKYQTLTIEDQEIQGWTFENKNLENYELIYVMQENGEMAYYIHEKTQNTFMLYSNEFLDLPKEIEELKNKNSSTTLMRNVFIGTTVVFVVSTAVMGYLYLSFKKKSISAIKDYYERKNQG